MFTATVIINEEEHREAIEEVESLFGSETGTAGYVRIHALCDVIEVYERTVFTLPAPSAAAIEEFNREHKGTGVLVAA